MIVNDGFYRSHHVRRVVGDLVGLNVGALDGGFTTELNKSTTKLQSDVLPLAIDTKTVKIAPSKLNMMLL